MTGASADGFTFHSGAGHIQLKGYYQSGQDPKLVNASIHLVVPSWGEVKLMDKQTIRLVQPTHVPVKVGGIDGKIKIKIANDLSTQVVLLDYDLATPYGSMKDKSTLPSICKLSTRYENEVESVVADKQLATHSVGSGEARHVLRFTVAIHSRVPRPACCGR
ncbi:hypothetical protein AG1IA_04842 [Rhizoctonia solani AG-1 IA]|uniref:Uncharacterized protein n=1 Tax=Thanatephorus cucumeris (strain AG1-IA) TaxID=983506 RepID=L8WWG2_THACA|nr:hypothetical protein AG1IA_04842 [Rhizoctonia solani AG-1 IA]